jgi:hypothetical protein
MGQFGAGDALPTLPTQLWDSLAFYNLLDASSRVTGPRPSWQWVFAAFYLFMLRLPAQQRACARVRRLLSAICILTAAVVFLTIAIPLKAEGRWLTIGWQAEGAALLWMAHRARICGF